MAGGVRLMSTPALSETSTIAVVGASLAGLRAAETLRAEKFAGRIVLVGAEAHLPYDRPPLSKQFLAGTWDEERIRLRSTEKIEALGFELHLGCRALSLDAEAGLLELEDDDTLRADRVVVATGSTPRTLPGTEEILGVHVLRTLEDAKALSADLAVPGRQVVVVGAGFIGGEVAATAQARGAVVTIVEALPVPLGRILGPEMGAAAAALHSAHGVTVRTGVGVLELRSEPTDGGVLRRVKDVLLSDGTVLPADVVVVGIGVVPNTGWLEDSGLEVRDGLVADATLYAADRVVVAGDLARWWHEGLGEELRIEHWTNAAEQGMAAARNLLAGRGEAAAFAPVPFFWSDQYDTKIQVIGRPRPDDEVVVVDGSVSEGKFVALYGRAGRLSAVLAFNRPRQLMAYRPLLVAGAPFAEALAFQLS
jgi:3-phenylpropionate/trans-cinnamate dioxygenase ferredoxin reductase subunit